MADERYITEDPELDDGQTADEDGETVSRRLPTAATSS